MSSAAECSANAARECLRGALPVEIIQHALRARRFSVDLPRCAVRHAFAQFGWAIDRLATADPLLARQPPATAASQRAKESLVRLDRDQAELDAAYDQISHHGRRCLDGSPWFDELSGAMKDRFSAL